MRRDNPNDPSFKPFNDGSPWKKLNNSVMPIDDEEKEDFFTTPWKKCQSQLRNWKNFLTSYIHMKPVKILKI
jgi:hypothetical protein